MSEQNLLVYAQQALDYGVMGTLGLMSLITFWLFIERMMFYSALNIMDYKYRDELDIDLTNNIGVLGAIGSNAPYVGLLGTVLGIMITFYTLGSIGDVDAKKIMMGLALALKATAMGLVVAMPAIIFYTITLRKVEKILAKFDIYHSKDI